MKRLHYSNRGSGRKGKSIHFLLILVVAGLTILAMTQTSFAYQRVVIVEDFTNWG